MKSQTPIKIRDKAAQTGQQYAFSLLKSTSPPVVKLLIIKRERVVSGWNRVQCMGRRHCCGQHLLWQRDHYGWDEIMKHHLIFRCMIRLLPFNLAGAFSAKSFFLSVEMERRIRMGPIEFISSLGGLFGLCLGFSFISFFEIVYWAIKPLFRSFIQHFYRHSLIQE